MQAFKSAEYERWVERMLAMEAKLPDPPEWEPGDPLAAAKGTVNAFLIMFSAACVVTALYLVMK
jgi:hypothetical protein